MEEKVANENLDENAEKNRLLSSGEEDDTPKIHYDSLPVGVWFIEWIGVLSRLDPVKKKKLYVCYYSKHSMKY